MRKRVTRFFLESTAFRRCLAILFHLVGIAGCYIAAHGLRFDFEIPPKHWISLRETFWPVVGSYFACVLAFGLYRGLWRFFTLRDCVVTAFALGAGTVLSTAVIFVMPRTVEGESGVSLTFADFPRSVLILTFMLLLLWEIGTRGMVRMLREGPKWRRQVRRRQASGEEGKRVLLVGDPEEADNLLRGRHRFAAELGSVVGILSERREHGGSQLRGVRIHAGLENAPDLVESLRATSLLFLPPCTGPQRIRAVVDSLAERKLSCDYRVLPSMDEIASGRVDVNPIRRVAIEDLLPRVPYRLPFDVVAGKIRGKRVLVSGAGGSIGSEIARQVLKFRPQTLVLFEISEFHLFEIEREISPAARDAGVRLIARTGDVKSAEHLRKSIREAGGVDLFYHAAAYKHVDLMERNPVACFQNNVIGTQQAAEVAAQEGVGDFVLISTDKAVRPTSLMGASKRLAERLIMERPNSGTLFKAVRFGNVLGSNGSVVPIFRSQIERGGPVTVTSPGVSRFFMTIPEAVELVLAAGAIDEDRRIFVLEMGEAVRIDALARRMIELSGLVPDVDIPVVYTGLKRGEKEQEELLTDDEGVVRTDLDRIWVVKKSEDGRLPPVDLGALFELIDAADEEGLRSYAHALIRDSRLLPDEVTKTGAVPEARRVDS